MVTQALSSEAAPVAFLQLAGHPLRWQLLSALARSDRTVDELAALSGEPHNLVSYHLGKLREAEVVSGRRSSADRRDTYYTVDLARIGGLLSDAGGALHPGIRLAAPREEARLSPMRVLFLCTGNSARSQMAEALVKARSRGITKAFSAGSEPKPLHPSAVKVMREEYGIDLSGYASKHLDTLAERRFDWVISLCDRVREVCPEFPGDPNVIHWSIANPVTGEPDDVTYPLFRQTARELGNRISFLLAALGSQAPQPRKQRRKS